jgi:hypothetical protein
MILNVPPVTRTQTGDCLEHPAVEPDAWTTRRRGKAADRLRESARGVCVACPLRVPCLIWATHEDAEGIWGGLDERERADPHRVAALLESYGYEERA